MIIAIDGTLASGKGTIAKRLSGWYGLPHMDTGRLYRATGVAAMNKGVDFDDPAALAEVARTLDLNDYSEDQLRTAEAGQAASKVAAVPEVRAALLELQRAFAHQPKGAVLDGRDIGTVVCPDADVKLWVDAAVEVRAERRWKELRAKGETLSLDEMIAQLQERDERDKTRKDAPMIAAVDSVLIDTTHLTIDAAVDKARAAVDAVIAQKSEGSGS
ncbi:MAG: (d)CMP kinase [Henriciella sp.]